MVRPVTGLDLRLFTNALRDAEPVRGPPPKGPQPAGGGRSPGFKREESDEWRQQWSSLHWLRLTRRINRLAHKQTHGDTLPFASPPPGGGRSLLSPTSSPPNLDSSLKVQAGGSGEVLLIHQSVKCLKLYSTSGSHRTQNQGPFWWLSWAKTSFRENSAPFSSAGAGPTPPDWHLKGKMNSSFSKSEEPFLCSQPIFEVSPLLTH